MLLGVFATVSNLEIGCILLVFTILCTMLLIYYIKNNISNLKIIINNLIFIEN